VSVAVVVLEDKEIGELKKLCSILGMDIDECILYLLIGGDMCESDEEDWFPERVSGA